MNKYNYFLVFLLVLKLAVMKNKFKIILELNSLDWLIDSFRNLLLSIFKN